MTQGNSRGRVAGKVALVTGSTSGIGEAIAELFAEEGAAVVVTGRSPERGAEVADRIAAAGGEAIFVQADVTDDAELDALISAALEWKGHVDILVNNAGTMIAAPFDDLSLDDWEHLVDLDARSAFYLMKKLMPRMEADGGGAVLNVTSLAAIQPMSVHALYGFVKAGVTHMTRSIAQDYAKRGVRVNSLLPGLVATPMVNDDPHFPHIEAGVPMGRASTPREQAYAALFLCSDEASYVTGSSLVVAGGI